MSFDVKALFTSVPIEPAVRIIKKLLEEDQTLRQRTFMAVNHIVSLLEFCLRSTYFTFKGRFYEAEGWCSYGLPHQPNCCQPVYGGPGDQGHTVCTESTIILEKVC